MNELAFREETDNLFDTVEEWLEQSEREIDFEYQEGVLKIILETGEQLILSRQSVLQEIWLAAPMGAYHFRLKDEKWVTRQGEELIAILKYQTQ